MLHSRTSADGYYDPRHGDRPVWTAPLDLPPGVHEPSRTNCFAIYDIRDGSGAVAADDVHIPFKRRCLLFFVPYQYVRFTVNRPVQGQLLEFHANFLCVETFHAEVGCSGALFNDPCGVPVLEMAEHTCTEVADLFARISRELTEQGLAHTEAALAFLKVLLIVATRSKISGEVSGEAATLSRHPVLSQLTLLIEQHYCNWHSPAQYADTLHMTPKTLGRIIREHLGTTLTDLIRRRILTHAKWQLLHTLRPVKELARELGFKDELYFSRLFKKATGLSPTHFRDFETAIRGGSNLSMVSGHAPILHSDAASDS